MTKITYYQAVWIDKSGAFRVNGTVAKSEDEAVRLCRKHYAVKIGAKLLHIDSWEEWID